MIRVPCLAALAAVALAGCATTPAPATVDLASGPQPQPAGSQMIVVGTLSTNYCESMVAPYYTQAIVGINAATSRVRAGTLTPDQGVRIFNLGRIARNSFDIACPNAVINVPALQAGQSAVNAINDILEGTK